MENATSDSQHVQTLNEGVIQKKHDGSQVPRCLRIPEQHLANITDIPGLWVSKTELPMPGKRMTTENVSSTTLPDDQRRVKHKCCLHDGQDEAGDQAEDRVGIGKRHDGQADVLGEEESSSLKIQLVFCAKHGLSDRFSIIIRFISRFTMRPLHNAYGVRENQPSASCRYDT
jgi:hypothetical protein